MTDQCRKPALFYALPTSPTFLASGLLACNTTLHLSGLSGISLVQPGTVSSALVGVGVGFFPIIMRLGMRITAA